MSAGNNPKTSVLDRCILECTPQTNDIDRFSVEKSTVLMTRHFAADVRLFEYIHRLQEQRIPDSEPPCYFLHLLTTREAIEDRIEIMQGMSDLIDRLFLHILQSTIGVESVLFEEETNLIAGGEEVIIGSSVLFVRRKDGYNFRRIKFMDHRRGTLAQLVACSSIGKTLDYEEAAFGVLCELCW